MVVILVLVALIALSSGEISANTVERAIRVTQLKNIIVQDDPGKGSFENCGTAKNFSITWTPKEPSSGGSLSIELNLITPYEWQKGSVQVDVFLKEMPETPIVQLDQDVTCEDVEHLVPQLKCPFNADDLVHLTYTVEKLPPLPPGEYEIKVQVVNEKKQQILCGKAEVTIKM